MTIPELLAFLEGLKREVMKAPKSAYRDGAEAMVDEVREWAEEREDLES